MFVTWLYLWALWECFELNKKRKCQKKSPRWNRTDGRGPPRDDDDWCFKVFQVFGSGEEIESLNCSLCLRWVTFSSWLFIRMYFVWHGLDLKLRWFFDTVAFDDDGNIIESEIKFLCDQTKHAKFQSYTSDY